MKNQRATFNSHAPARIIAAAAAVVTAVSLAACSDDSGSDSAGASSSEGESVDYSAIVDKAGELGYDCVENPDEDQNSGFSGGLACSPGADKVAEDPTFVVFGTDTVESGEAAAQAAIDTSKERDGEGAIDDTVYGDMYRTVDGDGFAGYCINTGDNCDRVFPGFGLTTDALDGAQTVEEFSRGQQDEAQEEADRQAAEAEREAEESEAAARDYEGWESIDDAVEQMDAWDLHCMEPSDEQGVDGTVCGPDDDLLVWDADGDALEDMGFFEGENQSRDVLVGVSDGDWMLMCRNDDRDTCDDVADRTGQDVDDSV